MSHASSESQLLRTPEQPKRTKQLVVEASPFTQFTKQLPDITTPRSTAATGFPPFQSPLFSPHVLLPSPSIGLGIGYPEQYIRDLGAADELAETETRFDRRDGETGNQPTSTSFPSYFCNLPSPSFFPSPRSSPYFDTRSVSISTSVLGGSSWLLNEPRFGMGCDGQLSSSWPATVNNPWQLSYGTGNKTNQENRRLVDNQANVYVPGSKISNTHTTCPNQRLAIRDDVLTVFHTKGRVHELGGKVRSARRKLIANGCNRTDHQVVRGTSSVPDQSTSEFAEQGTVKEEPVSYSFPLDNSFNLKSSSQQMQRPKLSRGTGKESGTALHYEPVARTSNDARVHDAEPKDHERQAAPPTQNDRVPHDTELKDHKRQPARNTPKNQTVTKLPLNPKPSKTKLVIKTGDQKVCVQPKAKERTEKMQQSPQFTSQPAAVQHSLDTGTDAQHDRQDSLGTESGSSPQSCGMKRLRSPLQTATSNPDDGATLPATSSDFCTQFARAAGLAAASAPRARKRSGSSRRRSVDTVSPFDTVMTEEPDGPPDDGIKRCSCKRSKCLKLYCDCFAVGQYCNESCGCVGCENTAENRDVVDDRRDQIKQRNPQAFQGKIQKFGNDSKAHVRGCNCKKSHCRKKYCECFQAGIPCGDSCRCEGCHNAPSDLIPAIKGGRTLKHTAIQPTTPDSQ